MNKATRTEIRAIVEELEEIKERIEEIKEQVQEYAEDEMTKLDNMEEKFGETERFYAMQEIQEHLQSAADSDDLDDIIKELESAIE